MGVGRTASGMSMLMGAAAVNIKAVVRNIDDYLLAPLGKALFAFNMQFNFDAEHTKGDLEVRARGTESLMRNEIRSQRLIQFMQMAQNPAMAPFVKYDYILREIAASMDLDEDKILNDPREAVIQAKMMPEIAALMPQQQEDLQQRRAAFRAYKIQPAVVVTSGQETLWSQKQTALSVLVGVQMVVTHHPKGSQFNETPFRRYHQYQLSHHKLGSKFLICIHSTCHQAEVL